MEDPRWPAIEEFLKEYIDENFVNFSVKRDTEFNTVWEMAYSEGGKIHLFNFIKRLEDEARAA